MYSQKAVDLMIKQWLNSSTGKQKLKELNIGVYTPEEMQAIGQSLAQDIVIAFLSIQRAAGSSGASMNTKGIQVRTLKNNKIRIAFPPAVLRRKSLVDYYGRPTGGGVEDIFGLFTQGWHASDYVYGSWDDAYQTDRETDYRSQHHTRVRSTHTVPTQATLIRSRKDYEGNPFISNVINKYVGKYPGLDIKYPSKWGGG